MAASCETRFRLAASMLVPRLRASSRKGSAGRVCVVGGSEEYAGAPYLCAMSAARTGADLVHVICPPAAAAIVKAYSPDLVVRPCDFGDASCEWGNWIRRSSVVVVGPGLGRSEAARRAVEATLAIALEEGLPVVVDADALYFVSRGPELVRGHRRCILTPNHNELRRLSDTVRGEAGPTPELRDVCRALGNVTILQKDSVDRICNAAIEKEATCAEAGCPRRCGGQGDILAGAVATFASWACEGRGDAAEEVDLVAACYGGALLTRASSAAGYSKHGRSMLASDILPEIGPCFSRLFPDEAGSGVS